MVTRKRGGSEGEKAVAQKEGRNAADKSKSEAKAAIECPEGSRKSKRQKKGNVGAGVEELETVKDGGKLPKYRSSSKIEEKEGDVSPKQGHEQTEKGGRTLQKHVEQEKMIPNQQKEPFTAEGREKNKDLMRERQNTARAGYGALDQSWSQEAVDEAIALLRRRLVGIPSALHSAESDFPLLPENEKHERQLETTLLQTIEHGFNNSALLLGPRGCGKTLVIERVLSRLRQRFPKKVSFIRLNGLVHSDERSSLREIARQLCADHSLLLAPSASFDNNLRFLSEMLHACAEVQHAVIFILDEFDQFAQSSKQSVLYSLFDALHVGSVQSAVLGISCRLDADQLMEKRIRSRFSNRRMIFLPPLPEDAVRLLELSFLLPGPPKFLHQSYSAAFNKAVSSLLRLPAMKVLTEECLSLNGSPQHLLDWSFRALCNMKRERGTLSLDDFKEASRLQFQQPRMLLLKDVSVLELFLLVAMKRLEDKECPSYTFNMVFSEYEKLKKDMESVGDMYSRPMALRAFEHLLERELIGFAAGRGGPSDLPQHRAVHLLVAPPEIGKALRLHPSCPEILKQWFSRESINKAGLPG